MVAMLSCALLTGVVWSSVTVYPTTLKVPIPPGEEATVGFWIENEGPTVVDVRIILLDWFRTLEGKTQFFPPGTLKGSCAPWIAYSPTSLSVPPGERVWVSVHIAVPKGEIGDRWALFLVAVYFPKEETKEGMGTQIIIAPTVKLLRQDPVNAEPAGEIRSVEVASLEPLKLKVLYANTGNAHTTNTGTVEIKDIFGETVREFTIGEFPTLPGEEHLIIVEDPSGKPLPDGIYYALVTIDFGGEYLVQGGVMFEVPGHNK